MDNFFGGKKYSKSAKAKAARRRMRRKNKETGNDRTLKELREIALINDVSIYRRRKDGNGFTKTKLAKGPLKARLTRMKVNYKSPRMQNIMDLPICDPTPSLMFGDTVCQRGYHPNPKWKRKPGQRQCLKGDKPKTLKELQKLAKSRGISIYSKKDKRKKLSMKALKSRLTKSGVMYKQDSRLMFGGPWRFWRKKPSASTTAPARRPWGPR